MKRMMIMAAAFAALVSCSKSETSQNPSTEPGTEETPAAVEYAFTEGETVTITAGTSLTKVSSDLNSDGETVDFKWQSGDKIKVTVGGTSSEFTVSELKEDGASAEFTGKMPASGNTFSVQYPVTDPDLTSQKYSSTEAIPHDKMKFTAVGCEVDEEFQLTAVYAAIRLNLYGKDQTVGKIVVTNTTSSGTYTLNVSPTVTLSTDSSNPTSFFIVVPVGEWKFSAEIFDGSSASICSFETSNAKTFEANQILNMSAKEVKKAESVLLPGEFSVSADKKVKFTKGNLWCDTTKEPVEWHLESAQNVTYSTLGQSSYTASHVCLFFWSKTASVAYAQDYSDESASIEDPFFCGEANAMTVDGQSGLYALSSAEWTYLIKTRTKASSLRKYGVTVSNGGTSYTNCLIIAPDDYSGTALSSITDWSLSNITSLGLVCLPAAGDRYESGLLRYAGEQGCYWSSTPFEYDLNYAHYLFFDGSFLGPANYNDRFNGYSVRLVCSVK